MTIELLNIIFKKTMTLLKPMKFIITIILLFPVLTFSQSSGQVITNNNDTLQVTFKNNFDFFIDQVNQGVYRSWLVFYYNGEKFKTDPSLYKELHITNGRVSLYARKSSDKFFRWTLTSPASRNFIVLTSISWVETDTYLYLPPKGSLGNEIESNEILDLILTHIKVPFRKNKKMKKFLLEYMEDCPIVVDGLNLTDKLTYEDVIFYIQEYERFLIKNEQGVKPQD